MELSLQEFLDSVPNKNTKKEYRHGIKKFCDWFHKSAEEILELRKDDLTQRASENLIEYRNRAARFEKEIEKFHSYLIEQGFSVNSSRNWTIGIRQLFRYYQMPITIRAGSKIGKTAKTTKNFPLTVEHIRAMFKVADHRERVILSLATDLGLRMGDFIQLKKTDIPDLSQEAPISMDIMTVKENIVAHGFISSESAELLKTYLPTLREKDNAHLFPSNGKSHISDEWVNRLLRSLADKAGVFLNGKRLSFHCFRKMFLSASINSGIGLTAGKKLCGKAVAESDDTYLTTVRLGEKFIQLKRFLTITPDVKSEDSGKMEALEKAVTRLQEELERQKLIAQTVTKSFSELKSVVSDMGQQLREARRATALLEKAERMGFLGIGKKE